MRGVLIALAALAAAIAADAQTITVSTPTQTSNQQVVTVTVSAPTNMVSKTDAVAMYPASQSNFTVSPPLKYKIITTYTTVGPNSVATLTFNLLNWRQSTVFYYLGTTTTPVSAGPGVESGFTVLSGKNFGSAIVTQTNPYEPTQIRLALASDPTIMTVSWTTAQNPPPQYVQYGTSSGNYSITVPVTQTATYPQASICGGFEATYTYIDPGLFNSANLTGLAPATRYFYRVGALATPNAAISSEYSFVSAPATGPASSVNIILSADMSTNGADDGSNIFPTSRQSDSPRNTILGMANEIQNNGYTMALMNGDLAYADGYLSVWELFSSDIQNFTAYAPFMIVDGNHERDYPRSGDAFSPNPGNKAPQGSFPVCPATSSPYTTANPYYVCDSKGECGSVTAARYSFPGVGIATPTEGSTSGGAKQKYYSYNYGPIHFISYSTEEPYAVGSAQYNFIAADLAAVNRTITPWVVASGHRPFYADTTDFSGVPDPSMNNTIPAGTNGTTDGDQYVALAQRQALEPLFAKYNVDLFYNGHKHTMFRTCAVRFGVCATGRNPDGSIQGTVYLTAGNAGRQMSGGTSYPLQEQPAYAPVANQVYGTGQDPFNLTLGGYYVSPASLPQFPAEPTHYNAYGYQRLFANATHMIVQPMNVTTIPAQPFLDASAAFTLTRIPPVTTAPPATTAAPTTSGPPSSTNAPVITTFAPPSTTTAPATNPLGLKQQIDAALGIPELIKPGQITGIAALPFAAGAPAPAQARP